MAVSKPSRPTPRDAHCEVSEGTVGHPVRIPRARQLPRRRGPVRDDATRPFAGSSSAAAGHRRRRPPRPKSTDPFADLIAERVRATDGRISAKRLLPPAGPPAIAGSLRHFRRAVAEAKAAGAPPAGVSALAAGPWRASRHRLGQRGRPPRLLRRSGLESCSASSGSPPARTRPRLWRCWPNASRPSAACPAVVLADRMGCLKGGVVANVVVPAPGYVAFAAHYGFRPDFCEAADPESKGIVENLVGYAKRDLVIPAGGWSAISTANADAAAWCAEVNGRSPLRDRRRCPPTDSQANETLLRPLPSLRPAAAPIAVRTVDRLRTVRYGCARYSVPGAFIGRQVELAVNAGELRHQPRRARRLPATASSGQAR